MQLLAVYKDYAQNKIGERYKSGPTVPRKCSPDDNGVIYVVGCFPSGVSSCCELSSIAMKQSRSTMKNCQHSWTKAMCNRHHTEHHNRAAPEGTTSTFQIHHPIIQKDPQLYAGADSRSHGQMQKKEERKEATISGIVVRSFMLPEGWCTPHPAEYDLSVQAAKQIVVVAINS